MNEQKYNAGKIKDLIQNSRSIAIIPSEVAGADSFSAATGLYHTLKSRDKDVSLVYVGNIPEKCRGIIDSADLTSDIYGRQLTVSIDYSDTPASKLAYSNEGSVLKLVLTPISKNFDHAKIKTQIQGCNFDLIFVLGVQTLEDLGAVYRELREGFSNATIVNLDNTGRNMNHGSVNIVDKGASSLSEVVFKLLSKVGITPNGKAARALLAGMAYREPQG